MRRAGDKSRGTRLWPSWVIGLVLLAMSPWLSAADNITLNFKEADIEAVIGAVAEITGKNFIIDPRVKAKVTIISTRSLAKAEAYEVFLSVLQVHGFAAVPSGKVIKIVPDVNAKQSGVPVVDVNPDGFSDEVVTAIIPMENISAVQLVPILRPLVPQQGHMVAYQPSNVLIISDRASTIARIQEIIDRIDLPGTEEDIEVIPLRHASAGEIVRILTTLDQQTKQAEAKAGGGVPSDSPILVADDRTNSILVGGGKAGRVRLRAIITHLDTPLETSGSINVVYLRYANAKDLVPVLTGVGQTYSQEQAKKVQPGTPAGAPAAFNIQADENTNALVITAPPEMFRSLQAVIRQLDVRRAQVYVEAIIADMTMNRAAELGVQWAADGSPGGTGPVGVVNFGSGTGGSITDVGGSLLADKLPVIGDGMTMAFGRFNSSTLNFAALVRALEGDGTTNILSTPTLVTLDNEEAEIVVGQKVPFITGSFTNTGGTTTPTNPFQTINRENVGVTLKVKPQINEGNTIKLDVEQKVENIATTPLRAADLITNTRSITTSVLIDDGEVLVLGGLITDDLKESVQRVPILGHIPILGNLFTYRKTTKDKSNLVVFLHPVIIRDQQLSSQLTNSKYNFMRAKQLEIRERGVALIRDKEAPVLPPLDELRQALPKSTVPVPEAVPADTAPPQSSAAPVTPPSAANQAAAGETPPPAAAPSITVAPATGTPAPSEQSKGEMMAPLPPEPVAPPEAAPAP